MQGEASDAPKESIGGDQRGNIILVGMMGSGKSMLGRQLAKRLRRRFVDSDVEIERITGASIPLIFEMEGESGFRTRESQVLQQLVRGAGLVLATGGGAVLLPENRSTLREAGTVIYLHAPVQILFERTKHSRDRPLLQVPDPQARLAEIYELRDPLYRATAHLIFESDRSHMTAVLGRLVRLLASQPDQATGPPQP